MTLQSHTLRKFVMLKTTVAVCYKLWHTVAENIAKLKLFWYIGCTRVCRFKFNQYSFISTRLLREFVLCIHKVYLC